MYVCLQKPANKLKVHANGDKYIRYFHQYFSPIFSMNFSHFGQLKKKKKLLIGPKQEFFLSLPVEKEIVKNIR